MMALKSLSLGARMRVLAAFGTVAAFVPGVSAQVAVGAPGDSAGSALSAGGEVRQQYEWFANEDWGAEVRDDSGYSLQRYMLHATDPTLSGGDVDARWEGAESGGDETVGGSTATPGQNVLDEIGEATGVPYSDTEELRTGEKQERRDKNRWELDPASSEDYVDRTKALE